MSVLICPVCGEKLNKGENSFTCKNKHCFDTAKEGYVNLLIGSKSGDKKGDSKDSARARHQLLSKGYYGCLKDYIRSKFQGRVLDICCGDGYYDDYGGALYGFDISKEMVRLAAKAHRAENYHYFAANLSAIPVESESFDTAIHLFAPFNEKEFSRVLKPGGRLYSVAGGENHLWEMKEILYDAPYKNDEQPPKTERLSLLSKTKISDRIAISGEDLKTLFSMTPYFYRTSQRDKAKLDDIEALTLTLEFIIFEYKKDMD